MNGVALSVESLGFSGVVSLAVQFRRQVGFDKNHYGDESLREDAPLPEGLDDAGDAGEPAQGVEQVDVTEQAEPAEQPQA
jgi:hypothetical protein